MRRFRPLAMFGLGAVLTLNGYPDDGGDFQDADETELENTEWFFANTRAFRLPNQAVTLLIGSDNLTELQIINEDTEQVSTGTL
jgi:hypothetical protein